MTPTPNGGKVLMQDKEKLLKLADVITSGKELDTRQKVERRKASFTDAPWRQSAGKRPKGGMASASDKLCAAKELLQARKARRKREKTRARKREHDSKKDGGSNGNLVDDATARRKRVSFV